MALNETLITGAFVLASFLCCGFGNSLEPLSLLAWLQPVFSLIAYDRLVLKGPVWGKGHPYLWHLSAAALLTTVNALGMTIGFAGLLSFPETTFTSLAAAFGFSMAISSVITAMALLGTHLACNAWPDTIIATVAFPCFSTCTHTLTSSFLSSFISPGNVVLDYEPLRQMCAVWGLSGAVFLMSAVAAVAYLHIGAAMPSLLGRDGAPAAPSSRTYEQLPTSDDIQKPGALPAEEAEAGPAFNNPQPPSPLLYRVTALLILAWCLIAVCGGILAQAGLLYQIDVTTIIPPSIQVSCLIESSESAGSVGWSRLWNRTSARLAAGDDLVLWAEESVNISFTDQEQLLQQARQMLQAHGSRSYLGLCYQALHADSNLYTNHFTLLAPDGAVAWDYLKAFPVPVVESEVMAGEAVLPIHDAPFGRLSGTICFDLDHAHYAMQAAAAGVDIMLQPSWTWGAVGPRHFAGNQLRALEGGYSVVRCSSSGVSGVVGPGGQVSSQVLTGTSENILFSVPLLPRRWTPYAHMGLHYVEMLNVAAAAVLWAIILLPGSAAALLALLGRSRQAAARAGSNASVTGPQVQQLNSSNSPDFNHLGQPSRYLHMSSVSTASRNPQDGRGDRAD